MPVLHAKFIKRTSFIKTNQFDGSWSAIIAAKLFKKRLIMRAGYILSQLNDKAINHNKIKSIIYKIIERSACKNADHIIVSSEHNKKYLIDLYHIQPNRITTVYNYIDISLFNSKNSDRYKDRLLFVGRLSPEKNLLNLVKALEGMTLTLDIYGEGSLKDSLYQLGSQLHVDINFMGSIPNAKMPDVYNKYKFFILPSIHEGMPKVLLESMACGCICIGTNVGGISELIQNEKTGYLIQGTSETDIRKTLEKIMKSDIKLDEMAILSTMKNHSVETIIEKEYKILKSIV